MSTTPDMEAQLQIAKLYKAVCDYSNPEITKPILERSVDVNYRIPGRRFPCNSNAKIECNTLLHVAYAIGNLENFKLLLQHRADFTVTDQCGSTILHSIIKNNRNIIEDLWKPAHASDFVNAVLSAQVNFGNYTNPCDKNGLSHFHIAVTLDNVEVMKLFLNNGVSVDESTNMDSSIKPGYSPLHFAVENCCVEAAELLISYGANMHLKSANGMTPLHLLVKQRLDTFSARHTTTIEQYVEVHEWCLESNEKIINMLLENDSTDIDCTDSIGLSKFHVACTLLEPSALDHLLDRVADIHQRVNEDSPFWPGYTGLHFAAHYSLDVVKRLVEAGADMTGRDAKGTTPFDICMRWFTRGESVHSLVASWPQLQNVTFSNARTTLLDCILAMLNSDKLKKFLRDNVDLNVRLPKGSPLWPGSTPLHLAFRFQSNFHVMPSLLKIQGRAWKEAANLSDENGLTYLHIACTDDDCQHRLVTKILSMRRSVESMVNAPYRGPELPQLRPGWTPLHVAARGGRLSLVMALLERGADVNRQDDEGFSPAHCFFLESDVASALLASKRLRECAVEAVGLTHLHVATWYGDAKAMTRLLRTGANVEARITAVLEGRDTEQLVGCTPLHLAIIREDLAAVRLLLKFGADVLATRSDGASALSEALTVKSDAMANEFARWIRDDEQLQKRLEEQLGLTMLHVACRVLDRGAIENLLKSEGVEVNAKTRDDLNFWPGFTPLHVLVEARSRGNDIGDELELLLASGADVTATNTRQCTAVHLALRMPNPEPTIIPMLKRQPDFSVNPVNEDGLSHFHCACAVSDLECIEKFLLHDRVDVNYQVDFFASSHAGYTPLHFAVDVTITRMQNQMQKRTVELLLAHEAKVNVVDSHGYTPLHVLVQKIANPQRFVLMKKMLLFSNDEDMNMRTIDGQTLIEMLLLKHNLCNDLSVWLQELKLLISRGGRINTCDPVTGVGYIGLAFSYNKYTPVWYKMVEIIENASGFSGLDEQNRNSIHNIVATFSLLLPPMYEIMIEMSIQHGCDVDHQDSFGRTSLHLAVKFKNVKAVTELLSFGADINIADSDGASAFSYIISLSVGVNDSLAGILAMHVNKLKLIGIEVSELNENLLIDAIKKRFINMEARSVDLNNFCKKVRGTEDIKIGRRGMTLRSFLYETAAISAYPSLTPVERDEVITFFESWDYSNYQELKFAIKLQYRKVVQRISLIAEAEKSFKALLGFPLPDLCVEVVLKFLGNSDLKRLIAASDDEVDMKMAME